MVHLHTLWLPIVLSSVVVFFISFVLHMLLPVHKNDLSKLPSEEKIMDALRPFSIPPGDYMMPCGTGPESMKDPAFLQRMKAGPVAVMTVMKSGPPTMGRSLGLWFIYLLVVSTFAAYVCSRAVGPGESYLHVFRFAGVTAFAGYALAGWQESIWFQRKCSTTIKNTIDGLIYALFTAGMFGWLWPR